MNLNLIFTRDKEETTESEDRARWARHMVELQSDVEESSGRVAQSQDSAYPAFLFAPIINEFPDDNYRVRGMINDDATKGARMLKRKYSNYFDYLDALAIYEEYIDYLITKYGTYEIIVFGVRDGLIQEYLPERPTLKNKSGNRLLLESGVTPSRKVFPDMVEGEVQAIADDSYPELDGKALEGDLVYDTVPKNIRKAVKNAMRRHQIQSRKSNIYNKYGSNSALDAIADFMRRHDASSYDKAGKTKDGYSVSEIVTDQHKYDYYAPELVEIILTPKKSTIQGGRMVDAVEEEQIEVLTTLASEGFDVLQNASKYMSKTSVRMLRSSIAPYNSGPMTKKELKKFKKQQKKEAKQMQKDFGADEKIGSLVAGNKVSFTRENSTLNERSLVWKMQDMFGDDED